MTRLVLDANVAIDWCINTPEGDAYSVPLADRITEFEFLVPTHFDVEVVRVLRKRHKNDPDTYPEKWLNNALQVLDLIGVEFVMQGLNFEVLGQLSKTFSLNVPDVPYLHLARTMGLPLATRDKGLVSACKVWGVERWVP